MGDLSTERVGNARMQMSYFSACILTLWLCENTLHQFSQMIIKVKETVCDCVAPEPVRLHMSV